MSQTLAIFLDAYRELNAKRMFWVTLALSGLFIGGFALLGIGNGSLTVLGFDFPVPMPELMYKVVLRQAVIGFWLAWGATVLALVSTAGIFPDFLAGGSVDLYLAKPIGRVRLFLTKYAAGLLFVLLQVLVFTVGAFLVAGLRAGQWEPSLFLAVPLVVCFFSYLYAVCVLLGVLTRSTIAALLLSAL